MQLLSFSPNQKAELTVVVFVLDPPAGCGFLHGESEELPGPGPAGLLFGSEVPQGEDAHRRTRTEASSSAWSVFSSLCVCLPGGGERGPHRRSVEVGG